MSGRRGGRGGGTDRGGRGSRGSNSFFRGANHRNTNGNGGKAGVDTLTQSTWMRGGTQSRGGGSTRGDRQSTPNAVRGRGNASTNKNTFASSSVPSSFGSDTMNSTPYPQHEYQQRLAYLKEQQPRIKAQLIANRQMEPDGPLHISQAVEKYGLCTSKCPELERVRRIAENDVKRPECTAETQHDHRHDRIPDETRMVKAFQRPAAGMENELMTEVRTPQTCLKSLNYMCGRLDEEGMDFLYPWIWDRSRGVRKDLGLQTIKNKDVPTYLLCMEECIRFHLLSLHYMARDGAQNYDPRIDRGNDIEQLRNSYTSLRARYEKNRATGFESSNEDEFRAYSIILCLSSSPKAFMDEVNRLPESSRQNRRIQTALEIYEAGCIATSTAKGQSFKAKQQNWVKFWELVQSSKVSYLMACAAELYFHRVRNHILDTLRCAYRPPKTGRPSPTEDWTVHKLMYCLGLDDHEQVKEFCGAYSFTFRFNSEGVEHLDVNSIPQNGELELPSDLKPQFHSARIVEPKRYGRSFSAIILGMNVKEARAKGLVDLELNLQTGTSEDMEQNEDETSLFIPDRKPSSIASSNSMSSATQEGTSSKLNPFASAFQPAGQGSSTPLIAAKSSPFESTKPNPFAAAANASATTSPFPGASPATIKPGLFDASKNTIQFSTPSTTNGLFSTKGSDNPFSKAAPNLSSEPVSAEPASTSSNPFTAAPATSLSPASTQSTPKPSTSWSFNSIASNGHPGKENVAPAASMSSIPTPASQPLKSPGFSFLAPPQPQASPSEDDRRKAEEEQHRKALQEQQRIAEQKRQAEESERRAREAVLQRQRQIKEEQERQQRAKEEAERKMRQEQEQARVAKQQAELRKQQEHSRALNSLAHNVYLDPKEGLLSQLLEHVVGEIIKEKVPEIEDERAENLARQMGERKRMAFARAVCVRWVQQVEKKKKRKEARRRREKLKAFRAQSDAMVRASSPDVAAPLEQSNGALNGFKKPMRPASVQRQKELPKPVRKHSAEHQVEELSTKSRDSRKRAMRSDKVTADGASSIGINGGYSQEYHNSTAPIDRTETDWFKLRAMGIDPSKHRKRSFGSISSDEEDEPELESKRARRSTSSSFRHSLPPPMTDEERIARFRAVQQALNRGSATPCSIDGNRSINGDSSLIIARAREVLADPPSPHYSLPSTHHKFSRSVPSVEMSEQAPAPHLSMFGRSIGAAAPNEKPAYWSRPSRFVPQHLYGKGADAVRAYRSQYGARSPASSNNEPLELSSPMPTQQSYYPVGQIQDYDMSYADNDEVDVEDEEELLDYEDEEMEEIEIEGIEEIEEIEEIDEDELLYDQGQELYDEEEEEEDIVVASSTSFLTSSEEEEPANSFGPPPGATQDDAIELSD